MVNTLRYYHDRCPPANNAQYSNAPVCGGSSLDNKNPVPSNYGNPSDLPSASNIPPPGGDSTQPNSTMPNSVPDKLKIEGGDSVTHNGVSWGTVGAIGLASLGLIAAGLGSSGGQSSSQNGSSSADRA